MQFPKCDWPIPCNCRPIWTIQSCGNAFRALQVLLLCWALAQAWVVGQTEAPEPTNSPSSDRLAVAIAALQRLKGIDLESNPSLSAVVLNLIDSTKGSAQYVELVRDFHIKGQEPALVDYASRHPSEAAGVDALRLVLAGDRGPLTQALSGPMAASLAECLGNTGERSAVPLITPLLTDPKRDSQTQAKALHALVLTHEGCEAVLQLAKEGRLIEELKLLAGTEFLAVRWPELRTAALSAFPSSSSRSASSLPPVAELCRRKGNATHGSEVFNREAVGCFKCHQVNGHGTDFGPNLSEIGTKLAKEAIYDAILDPSAGIAFGYEAWEVELKNGDEAFGLLASETNDEIAIKAQSGIVTRYKKSDVQSRIKLKTSIMPNGLAQLMSQQDLVDLVEYLSSLKKASGQPVGSASATP